MTAPAPAADYTFTPDPVLEALLQALHSRFPRIGKPDLAALARLMSRLGNPHLRLPPVFHVAGTNGKGSTVAFLRALLEAGGKCVHVYTSPHLIRFEERYVLAGQVVDPALLTATFRRVADLADDDINFSFLMTAVALVLFADHAADAVLLETGVGGDKDATNIIPAPEVSLITRISFDHMQLLGDTLAQIATAKAGIIKPGCPVVVAPQPDATVWPVFTARAAQLAAPLIEAGRVGAADDDMFTYDDGQRRFVFPQPALMGAHQLVNAATAMTALAHSRFAALLDDPQIVATAMRRVCWPARLQRLTHGPLCTLLGPHDELWLDGAHNDSGAEALAAVLADWRRQDARPIHLLTLMKSKKDWQAIVMPLMAHIDSLSCLRVDFDNLTAGLMASADVLWEEISAALPPAHYPAIAAGSGGLAPYEAVLHLRQRLDMSAAQARIGQRIVIAGSLYLAGHILRDHS